MSAGFTKVSILLIPLVLLSISSTPITGRCETPGLEKINEPIKKNQSNLQRLQKGMKIHLGRLQIIGEQEFNLLDQIERLDRKLALQKIRLDVMVERLNSQEELLVLKKQALRLAKQNKQRVKKHLQKRLRSFYLMGKTGILNVTFSTRTLPDLMVFNDSYMSLLDYDKTLFDEYRESIDQLTLARDAHEHESKLLTEFITNTVEQQQELDTILIDKKELLEKVNTQKILHEQAISELKKAEADLLTTLVRLKKKREYTRKGFVMNKGKMPQPVSGKVLTSFGEERGGVLGSSKSQGITFDAPNGSSIKAIFPGRVIFSGYRKGFGNMVIIDHGLDYFSITSRMEKIDVKNDDIVSAGDIIGSAGDIATLFEKGLYFEIRHDTEPLDPEEWIQLEQ